MMTFKDYEIKRSYISFGDDNIAEALIKPLLKVSKSYKRSVGFFSSSVFQTILPGIVEFARNGGKIQLITSPILSESDVQAINAGYVDRENKLKDKTSEQLIESLQDFDSDELNLLVELISNGILDIKLVVTNTTGMYHDKLGILTDTEENKVVFYGSANSSYSGYRNNYERVRVVKSWVLGDEESINDEVEEFDKIWAGENEFLDVFEFSEEAKHNALSVIEYKKSHGASTPIKLRSYQEEARDAWIRNGYKGFFVMATGTGKTWTALFSAKELLREHSAMVVICAPYKHLVKQWAEDVQSLFTDAKIILISSENLTWEKELNEEIIRQRYENDTQIIAISTISSFNGDRFKNTIRKSSQNKLLIVDEAHRFTQRDDAIKDEYSYLLGLSATPHNGKSMESGNNLMSFFGGKVFDLPIEKAIGKYLVNYKYVPIYVSATEGEEEKFSQLTRKIATCFKKGTLVNGDGLSRYMRERLRIMSMAQEKIDCIENIIDLVKEHDHFVVYCGDGQLFIEEGNEIRHIQFIKDVLNQKGYKPSQFTAMENMDTRMRLVKAFNKGEIDALAAIRCLDEGINIPSIESALILSSNDSYREFVQRRGRILRLYKDKKEATIYDVIVLPSKETKGIAQIELRRFNEYAKLATNGKELMSQLNDLLNEYDLTYDDITFDDSIEENVIDE